MLRTLSSLFVPVVILAFAVFFCSKLSALPGAQLAVVELLPIVIALISLVLCLRFNRSLVFFATLSVVVVYVLMQWYLPRQGWVEAKILWMALCLFLPLNIMMVSLLRERGMMTWWGSTRFALILLPTLIIMLVVKYYPEPLLQMLSWRVFDSNILKQVNFAQIPMFMMVFAVLVLNGRWFMQPSAQNSSLFVALFSAVAMLYFRNEEFARAVFASAAMLMLVIAVIQESWSMAYIDQLTSLPGRRALEEELLKLGSNYAIAMMDIDHFKKFNDTYGHDAGDQVLQMVAARIRQSVSAGKAFRYGGEEFTVVFPGRRIDETLDVLEAIRDNIGGSHFQLRKKDRRSGTDKKDGGKNVEVTISIGIAERTESMVTPHEVVKGADKALYRAKKKGRNRVSK